MDSRPPKASDLETIKFEIDMLRFSYKRLIEDKGWENQCDKYVYLEAFLLHYRNLSSFFAGKGRSDELKVDKPVWAGKLLTPKDISELTDLKPFQNYWDPISQYLQHLTTARASRDRAWNINVMFQEIEPLLIKFDKMFSV